MVSVTKNNTPALRFDGFDGEWGAVELQQIADIVGGGTPSTSVTSFWDGDIDWYSPNEIGETAIAKPSNKRITRAGLANSSARLLPAHRTVLFTSRASIGHAAILDHPATTNQGFQSFVLEDGVDTNFVYALTPKITEIAEQLATGSTFLEVSNKTVREIEVHVPATEEQRAIGELFADLDALIEQHRIKHANLQQTKTALLQRMFPQDDADEPELRLGGFSGAWENQPFSDLVAYRGHNSLSRADLTKVPTSAMNIHYGDILVKYGSVVDVSQTDIPFVRDVERLANLSRQSLSDGDILFADAAEDSTVGKCVEVQGISDNLVLAGLHTISARPVRRFAPGFLGHALNAPSFHNQLLSKMQGTKVSSISISTLAETVFSFPTLQEQRAIGEVFSNLDELIAAESRYIAQLMQAKTALLQRMFI